jgi:hypothetical protein
MPTLLRAPHFVLELNLASRYVRLVRTTLAFTHPDEAAVALKQCQLALQGVAVAEFGILLDWRLGPLSTDPQLHQAIVEHTDNFAMHFARRALLIVTPVGQLQLGRVIRTHSDTNPVLFNDEQAAVEYLMQA